MAHSCYKKDIALQSSSGLVLFYDTENNFQQGPPRYAAVWVCLQNVQL